MRMKFDIYDERVYKALSLLESLERNLSRDDLRRFFEFMKNGDTVYQALREVYGDV